MLKFFMVTGTDDVNRHKIRLTADVYANALEDHAKDAMLSQLPVGSPMHFTHDMHRVIGWSTLGGLFTDGRNVKYVQHALFPATDDEERLLKATQQRYLTSKNNHYIHSKDAALTELSAKYPGGTRVHCNGGVGVLGPGIAAKAFPHLFEPDTSLVDKDGLVNYRELVKEFKEIQPGVFRSADRKIALVVHPFLRRSLSRQNSLNSYFLERFAACAETDKSLSVRVKLDPDLILSGQDIKYAMEFEYWIGPKFTNDIASIPSGVTQHKASERTRRLEGIAMTDFWWKVPEEREEDGEVQEVRTFEMEEVVDLPSFGVGDEYYGCRYVHTEFTKENDALSHFDGAIRGYAAEAYFERLDKQINHAGKNSDYTKLFRIDGALSVETWKGLVCAFYRGNILVPEYLEDKLIDPILVATSAPDDVGRYDPDAHDLTGRLCALVTYVPAEFPPAEDFRLVLEEFSQGGSQSEYLEYRPLNIHEYLSEIFKLKDLPRIHFQDGGYNIPRVCLPGANPDWTHLADLIKGLRHFIDGDVKVHALKTLSCAFTWYWQDLEVNFSLAGDASKVSAFLAEMPAVIDFSRPPSKWIEALKMAISKHNGKNAPAIDPDRIIQHGERLIIIRPPGHPATLAVPPSQAGLLGINAGAETEGEPPAPMGIVL